MNTLTPPAPVSRESRSSSARSSTFTACKCGLLGLLPGPGLILAPIAMGKALRELQVTQDRAAPSRSGQAWFAMVLSILGLLVQTAAIGAAVFFAAGGFHEENDPERSNAPDIKQPAKPAEVKKVEVGKNVTLEVIGDKRRVLVQAYVCMRDGQLEQLLTRKLTKEHEAVLAADVDARHIHTALILAGAKEGSPVKFQPKYQPASGSSIKVTLQYEEKGKLITRPAQDWVRNMKTRKNLNIDWVFAGSRLVDVPLEPGKKYYVANDGDIICVSNFDTAMLDLPVNSTKDNADLAFEAHTERIPPRDTKVTVILEVVEEKK